jgi:hypothetical protein
MKAMAALCPARSLSLQVLLWDFEVPSYDVWVAHVERAILYQIDRISEKRNYLKDLGEDALTTVLQLALDNLMLNCSAAVVNGNVDMVVEYRGYKWLGEAKIAADAQKIFHGYNQLTSRYATGQPNQTSGGMLLYCKHERADVIMNGWRAIMEGAVPGAVADGPTPLSFRSVDARNGAGQPFQIVHLAFPLYHVPEEDTWVLSKELLEIGRLARKKTKDEVERRASHKQAAK